jgi:hypothetical protein
VYLSFFFFFFLEGDERERESWRKKKSNECICLNYFHFPPFSWQPNRELNQEIELYLSSSVLITFTFLHFPDNQTENWTKKLSCICLLRFFERETRERERERDGQKNPMSISVLITFIFLHFLGNQTGVWYFCSEGNGAQRQLCFIAQESECWRVFFFSKAKRELDYNVCF